LPSDTPGASVGCLPSLSLRVMRTLGILVVFAVVFTDCLLVHFLRGAWNYYWLFAVGCAAVLNLHWTLAARHTKPVLSRWSWILWLVSMAEFLLYSLPLSAVPILGWRLAPHFAAVEILGAVMCTGGVGLAIWSRRVLAESWNNVVALRDGHALVQDGPYAMVRHPIYLGFMLLQTGMILALGEVRALVWLLDIVVFFRRMRPEEKILEAKYPNEYAEYERRVKRLLPCIW
jgi:protein-S-isoprenylcysteine O-methyltransferase Ste14